MKRFPSAPQNGAGINSIANRDDVAILAVALRDDCHA
jgi:hypothetical protein